MILKRLTYTILPFVFVGCVAHINVTTSLQPEENIPSGQDVAVRKEEHSYFREAAQFATAQVVDPSTLQTEEIIGPNGTYFATSGTTTTGVKVLFKIFPDGKASIVATNKRSTYCCTLTNESRDTKESCVNKHRKSLNGTYAQSVGRKVLHVYNNQLNYE